MIEADYQPLEYDERTRRCAQDGHDLVLWPMTVENVVNLRQLCRSCGRTFAPAEQVAAA